MSDISHKIQPLSSEPVASPIGPPLELAQISAQPQPNLQTQTEQQKRKRGRPPKPRPSAAAIGAGQTAQTEGNPAPNTNPRPRGAPKGNSYAAKPGNDLRVEVYLSKTRRAFFEQWFELRYGIKAASDEELREVVRQIADRAITQTMIEEFERHRPGSVWGAGGEVF